MSYRRHLVKGLRLLGERRYAAARRWIDAGQGGFDKAIRMVMIGVGGYILWRVLSASWRVLAVTVVIVCLLALRAATKATNGGQQAKVIRTRPAAQEKGGGEGLPSVTAGEFLHLLYEVMGPGNGVHLRALAAALTARTGTAWDVAAVRVLAEAADVPVSRAVRAPGGVTVGVKREDVPPLPAPASQTPEVVVVSAGQLEQQAGQQQQQHPIATPVDEVGFRLADDPSNPRRTHVQWLTKGR